MFQTLKKGKWIRRSFAFCLALLMVASLLPTGLLGGVFTVKAESTDLVLNASDMTEGDIKEEITVGDFTLGASSSKKLTVQADGKTSEDGLLTFTKRLKTNGGSGSNGERTISFTTTGKAEITVYMLSGSSSDAGRMLTLVNAAGETIGTNAAPTSGSGGIAPVTYEVTEAGTYTFQASAAINLYYIGVKHAPTVKEMILDAGAMEDGDIKEELIVGDFTLGASSGKKLTVQADTKTSEDGLLNFTKRLKTNGGSGSEGERTISFTTTGAAEITVYMLSGSSSDANRILSLEDAAGNTVGSNAAPTSGSGGITPATYEVTEAGTYTFKASAGINIYYIKVVCGAGAEAPAVRPAWDTVAAPVLGTPKQDGNKIEVPFTMIIGNDGADSVTITMKDEAGKVLDTKTSRKLGTEGTIEFDVEASGTYQFSIVASREEETDKTGKETSINYILPLIAPVITSATNLGQGRIELEWGAVKEADEYKVYVNGASKMTVTDTTCVISGLTAGTEYAFVVAAIRKGDIGPASTIVSATATLEAQQKWATTIYGPSTNTSNNGFVGNLNEDGKITVFSEGGKGKIQNTVDGLAFYYTAIPTSLNFTLRAKVTVDSWKFSNGQEGFGLMVADALGTNGSSASFWTNQYMALATKVEYNSELTGSKYSMKLGLGALEKSGITKEALEEMVKTGAAQPEGFTYQWNTLDETPDKQGLAAGTYNIFGNCENKPDNTIAEMTEVLLEIQRNNNGYYITYYDNDGNVLKQVKYYGTDKLDQIDSEYVYAGFFASRNARVTFSDVVLTTISPENDTPEEGRPVEKVEPKLDIPTADITNSDKFTLSFIANVAGTIDIKCGDEVIAAGIAVKAGEKVNKEVAITGNKEEFTIEFTPDPNQDLGEYKELANADKIVVKKTITRNDRFENYNNIYVSPDGTSKGMGTRKNPVDIYTAVACAKPGQTIVLLEGTYLLDKTVRIERGMDGTKESPIRMIADPQAKNRPVFDFKGKCAGMVFGGDYWYFQGFDVTKSANGQKGLQLSGSNNVIDQVNAYYNGNTGIQISRLYGSDLFNDWPANNLVLNCTSHGNADAGYEDADGFAAKLTVGEGNIFDGCIAYNNADDGWDLFAKTETGSIGAVTIRNCVAYANGYLEDGTNAGNGNGFKMGGSSIGGKHVLINSFAFFNKAKGIDSNSCPDIRVYNCTSYNNEKYNVAFYTNDAANTAFEASGILSIKDASLSTGFGEKDNIKLKGTQDTDKVYTANNYYWDGSKSVNKDNAQAQTDWIVSYTFNGIGRKADGTIDMKGFLTLSANAPAGVGAVMGGTASADVSIEIDRFGDLDCSAAYVVVLLGAALATAGFFAKKRFA